MQKIVARIAILALLLGSSQTAAYGQDDINQQLQTLTQRVNQEREVGGAALFLFGAFCALWAQNTNRNAWLWFFMGVLFSVITVIVLLVKNSREREAGRRPSG